MPAASCSLVDHIIWTRQRRQRREGRTGAELFVFICISDIPTNDDPEVERLRGDIGEPTARSATRFTKNTVVSSDLAGHQTETYL